MELRDDAQFDTPSVEQPTKFELVINLETAKTLLPASVIALADGDRLSG
jgi:hypothetical protein